jgi:glycolate oxidase
VVDPSIYSRIEDILPPDGLLTDPEELERYRRDASGKSSLPSAVLLPQTTNQIQGIVQLAHEERLPLTVRGGGTGLRGGAVAREGGILLSLEHMDRILEISPENMLAVVQPGMSAHRLEEHLKTFGLSYPVDPASWRRSTIGGDVATRAHGLRGTRHGSIGSYLLSLEVVISPGEIIRCGAKTLKCATGYHLVDLFAGSRGQLGIITEVILKLLPRPAVRRTLLAVLEDLRAAEQIEQELRVSGLQPSRLELIDPELARLGFGKLIPPEHRNAFLMMMELGACDQPYLDEQAVRAGSYLEKHAVLLDAEVREPSRAEVWWRCREELLTRSTAESQPSLLVTLRLPVSRLNAFWEEAGRILNNGSSRGLFYGHLGEGRWHLLVRRLNEQAAPGEALPGISRVLQEAAVSCGGLYLAPVPLGWSPEDSLIARHDSGQGRLWRSLKNRFDPLDIFGPPD